MEKLKYLFKTIIYILIINIFLIVFMEGLFSIVIVLNKVLSPIYVLPIGTSTKYDSLLGWINSPNYEAKNFFGPGICLKTNSQSFRNSYNFSVEVPKNRIRIVCSGGILTFGYGVDNEHTWCRKLESLDKRFETVNAGGEEYSIGQSYLWYMRDVRKLEHKIQILALTTESIEYAGLAERGNYDTPLLKLVNSVITVTNSPIPNHELLFQKLEDYLERVNQLRLYEIFQRALNEIPLTNKKNKNDQNCNKLNEANQLVLRIVEDLQEVNNKKGSTLVVVYLPKYGDCDYRLKTNEERKWLNAELAKRGILFIDLYNEFLKLSLPEVVSLFSKWNTYYSEKGNEYIARTIYKKLRSFHKLFD